MKSIIEINSEWMDERLSAALEGDLLHYFVLCYHGFTIYKTLEDNTEACDITYTMEAIYRYCQLHPESDLGMRCYNILMQKAQHSLSCEILYVVLQEITYQMNNEKNGHAPFKWDIMPVLNAMKNNIDQHIDAFKNLSVSPNNDFDDDIYKYYEIYSDYINQRMNN